MKAGELLLQVWLVKVSDIKQLEASGWQSLHLHRSCPVFCRSLLGPAASALIKLWDIDMRAFYLKINKHHDFSLKALLQARRIVGDYLNSAKLLFFLATGNRRNLFSAQAWKPRESSHNTLLQPVLLSTGLYLIAWQLVFFVNEDSLGVCLSCR